MKFFPSRSWVGKIVVLATAIGCTAQPRANTVDAGPAGGAPNMGLVACQDSSQCPAGQFCCGNGPDAGACTDLKYDPRNCGSCGATCDSMCYSGTCANVQPGTCFMVPGDPEQICDGTCVHTNTDPKNCGGCGLVCASGVCNGEGKCATTCAYGYTSCLGTCVDLQNDNYNCGACNNFCQTMENQACTNGSCQCPPDTGTPNLCGPISDSICTNFSTDPANCGSCGYACGTGTACVNGQCPDGGTTETSEPANYGLVTCTTDNECPAGQNCCEGSCTDLKFDALNCGGCGTSCNGGSCFLKQCQSAGGCSSPYFDSQQCGADCVDPDTDPFNCGICGTVCRNGEICNGEGHCGDSCAPGYTDCLGSCVDLRSDYFNCGACNTFCQISQGQSCVNGACQCPANDGIPDLCGVGSDSFCTNLKTDSSNCGTCGYQCPNGTTCNGGGVCTSTSPPDGGIDVCLSACPGTCSPSGMYCYSDSQSYCTPCAAACYGATTVACP